MAVEFRNLDRQSLQGGNEFQMNELLELLKTRRSVAPIALSGPGPSTAELESLLQIASRVPDHGKLVPFRFIIFEGDARLAAGRIIAEAAKQAQPDIDESRLDIERKRLALAPVVVGVVSRAEAHKKIPEWEQVLTSGAVCMNLLVAAQAMGFAASWLTQWYSYDRRVVARFGVAESERMSGFVHIGHASGRPEDRVRPNLSEIVTRFEG
jgi:nitroreductase